jgi:methionyl-tRNA formyltransferase
MHNTKDINDAASIRFVQSCAPDLLVTAYFNQLVGQPVLSCARLGGINIHPSLLPHYRGTDPVFHALSRHECEIGVTVHRLDEQFDTGPILRQAKVPVTPGRSLFHYYTLLFSMGAQLACYAARHLREGGDGQSQVCDGGYDGWPSSYDVSAFCRSGGKLIALKEFSEALRLRPRVCWTEGNESPRV